MRPIRHLEALLAEERAEGTPRPIRLELQERIRATVRSIREALPEIKAPAPPPRDAPRPLAKPKQRKTHLRAVDPILAREQTLREAATVRELLAAVNWQGLTELAALRIAKGYRNGRPGLRNIIERELVLLAAEMTLREDESARVVMALLAVIRRTEASAA